jgi:hypothetical protein
MWLMQRRADKFESAGYLGMTMKTLESTYGTITRTVKAASEIPFPKGRSCHDRGIVAVRVWPKG